MIRLTTLLNFSVFQYNVLYFRFLKSLSLWILSSRLHLYNIFSLLHSSLFSGDLKRFHSLCLSLYKFFPLSLSHDSFYFIHLCPLHYFVFVSFLFFLFLFSSNLFLFLLPIIFLFCTQMIWKDSSGLMLLYFQFPTSHNITILNL